MYAGGRLFGKAHLSVMGQDSGKSTQSSIEANLISKVGSIISRERKQRQMTIAELAGKAGISSGLLSQLERGLGNPSIETLSQLARTLSIPIGTFFETASTPPGEVIHPHTRRRLMLEDTGMTYQLLVPDMQGSLSMLYIELPPGFSNVNAPFNHHGEEVVFVLSGSIEIHIGDREWILAPGDSIRFHSTVDHWYRTFDERVVVITAQSPPSF
ncbi:MAG: helix-turn-helix domain-containing protein [Rhizobiaceae bacterium]